MTVCVCSVVSDSLRPHGACQALLSVESPRQENCSGFPFPTPGGLPHPGIELESLGSPALATGFFTTAPHRVPSDGYVNVLLLDNSLNCTHRLWNASISVFNCK